MGFEDEAEQSKWRPYVTKFTVTRRLFGADRAGIFNVIVRHR
jgi:hypothetical protein